MSLYLYQSITLTPGETYKISFDYSSDSNVSIGSLMYAGVSASADIIAETDVTLLNNAEYDNFPIGPVESGTQTFNIIAGNSQDTLFITNIVIGGGQISFDNISIKKVLNSDTIDSGILSNYDFDNFKGDRRNMRAGFLTVAGNDGKLQYRYKVGNTVSWIDLMTGLTTVKLCFCNYWDNTALLKYVLWVDGSNNIYSWNGAVTTFASATSNTLTTQGSLTWQQLGYTATGSITINGVTATYSGGYTTNTLTGVSVDLSAQAVSAEIHQTPVTTALSGMTSILATFAPTVIGCGRQNQVYVGSSTSNNLYISKVNDYTTYTFTAPTRVVGEGMLIPLDAPPKKFLAQEVTASEGGTSAYDMWISEGLDHWAVIRATLSTDNTKEKIEHIRLKTSPRQGAFSERMVAKMKNHIMYIDNNNVASFVGYVSYQYIPTIVDFSYPIIDDMNLYDFTDGSIFFHKNYAYVAIPKSGLIRVYNMTDQTKDQFSAYKAIEDVTQMPWFWEAPLAYPISGFYVTADGELGGHNYTTSESYLLFKGGSFNGQDITNNATFSFDDKGDRTQSKASDELWIEGYIKQNTILNCAVVGDLDAFQTAQTVTIDGSDSRLVGYGSGGHALGKNPLGSKPLGGADISSSLPSWFHGGKTYPQIPFYIEQLSFQTKGVDLQWELIDFGTNSKMTSEGNNSITE